MKRLAEKLKRAFCDMKMSQKLSLILAAIVSLSLGIVARMDWTLYDRDIGKATDALFMQISVQVETVMDTVINNLDAIAKAPLYASTMQDELRDGEILSSDSIAKIQYATESFNTADRLHHVIAIYNKNGHVAYFSSTTLVSYLLKNYYDLWYEAAKAGNGSIRITGFPVEEQTYCCTVSRIIKSVPQMEEVGLISISVPRSVFDKSCTQIQNIRGGAVVVLDGENNVIYSSQPLESTQTVETLLAASQQSGEARVDTEEYLGYCAAENAEKYSVLIYTAKDEFTAGQIRIRRVMLLFALLVCLTTILLVAIVANNTTRPLRRIAELMVRVQDGDWSVRFHARYRDEIGILGKNFNQMLEKMNEMTEQLITVSTSKKQAEIDALQGQINPHFMYNTLEFFRMMAVEKDDFVLAELICSFGKMLRYNITTMNETTTIAQEVEYLGHFLYIYNARHARKIALRHEVPEELLEYPIIKLLLQPIVENAVLHGLELAPEREGIVLIRVCREADLCRIDICDNGLGMPPEKLDALRKSIRQRYAETTGAVHIGLRNVNERIRLYYGDAYGLTIDSEAQRGTCVHITLPYHAAGGIS